jgi:nucleotide-binding universal stress UspA family protein
MKTILFPTDFSDNAKNAIYYGLSLYGNEPCKFILLNTFFISYSSPDVPEPMSDITSENADKFFNSLIEQINKDFPKNNFEFETNFRVGDLTSTTSSIIEKEDVDLIIMGTQGASGLAEILIGSRTASIIKNVNCPVLAIPEEAEFEIPTKIVLAIDDESEFSEITLHPLLEIIKKVGAEVLVLHISDNNKLDRVLNNEKINQIFKSIKFSYHLIYNEEVLLGIEKFVEKQNASMLGMITHKLNLFERIFYRSITKKMSLHSKIPLLALKDKK